MIEDGIAGWARAGLPLAATQQITAKELREHLGDYHVVDVRWRPEWEAGHIDGAELHPLDGLAKTLSELPRDRPLAVHCKSGYRSVIACSMLEAAGFEHVANLTGGFDAWTQ